MNRTLRAQPPEVTNGQFTRELGRARGAVVEIDAENEHWHRTTDSRALDAISPSVRPEEIGQGRYLQLLQLQS